MKKFLSRLALALVPIVLYLAFFVLFEQNNYFGIKNADTMYSRIKGYTQALPSSIIIGDSRLANFDMEVVQKASGREWYNLAFGGATIEESLDLLEYTIAENADLKEVVFGLSFYTVNKGYGTVSRMSTIEKQIENPVAYISNFQHNIDAAVAFVNTVKGVPLGSHLETAVWTDADYRQDGVALHYRKNLIAYSALLYSTCAVSGVPASALTSIDTMVAAMDNGSLSANQLIKEMENATPQQSRFEVNMTQVDRLIKIAQQCAAAGIQLTVVMPPMHESVRALVCQPLAIAQEMEPLIAYLSSNNVKMLVYEWGNVPIYDDSAYYDGFHLDLKYGLPQWTNTLFTEVNEKWA